MPGLKVFFPASSSQESHETRSDRVMLVHCMKPWNMGANYSSVLEIINSDLRTFIYLKIVVKYSMEFVVNLTINT